MYLARRTIEYFDMSKEDLNDVQLNTLAQLNEWRDSRIKDILSEQDNKDFDNLVSKQEMQQLWRWVNEISLAATAPVPASAGTVHSPKRTQI
jgi:hypothetical protein